MNQNLKALTADIVTAHVGTNTVALTELPGLISSVYRALAETRTPSEPEPPKQKPAVPIRSSVTPNHIISLESGRKLKTLKRYLMHRYGMSPDAYRQKWGLPADYPMTAPNFSAQRQAVAVKMGLAQMGRKAAKPKPPVLVTGKRRK
jgi:predicted transcriptional regulator